MNTMNTTIKLDKKTKERLDHLKEYKRETYDDLLQKILEILNICKANPERARARLATRNDTGICGRAGAGNCAVPATDNIVGIAFGK